MSCEIGLGPLAPELRSELRKMMEATSALATAAAAGVSTVSVYRALAGLPLQPGTRLQIASRLAAAPPRAA